MCLDKLSKFKPATVGYKVFSIVENELRFIYKGTGKVPINKWIDEKDFRWIKHPWLSCTMLSCSGGCYYRKGFHTWHTLKAVRAYHNVSRPNVIYKVLIKDPVATGYQNSHKVTVSKKIRLVKRCG